MKNRRKKKPHKNLLREIDQDGSVECQINIHETGIVTRASRRNIKSIPTSNHLLDNKSPPSSSEASTFSTESDSESISQPSAKRGVARTHQGGKEINELQLPKADIKRLQKLASRRCQNDNSLFVAARSALTLATLPENLPCRDSEKQQIDNFLTEFFTSKTGMYLYICGVPGTGKTATTMEIVAKHKAQQQKAKFVQLNCLSMMNVSDLYSAFGSDLLDDDHNHHYRGKQAAFSELSRFFSQTHPPVVLVLDEMDALITKKATVAKYQALPFLLKSNGGVLCIIGISNTIDLQEQLPSRIQSRMGKRTLIFQPYTKQQMISIIKHRISGVDVFEDLAIQRAAAKVSGSSGDVRRVLQLLQLTIDLQLKNEVADKHKITAHDVGEAISRMFGEEILTDVNVVDRLSLASMLQLATKTEAIASEISVLEILQKVQQNAQISDLPVPSDACILATLGNLQEAGIIKILDSHKRLAERVVLELDEKQTVSLICEDSRLEWLRNALIV